VIRTMPHDVATYKSIAAYKEVLLQYLDAFAR